MTQDEIINMAREAGDWNGQTAEFNDVGLERFAAIVATHEAEKWKAANKRDYENWKMAAEKAAECEREACAKVCDVIGADMSHPYVANNCAAAIRARGEK